MEENAEIKTRKPLTTVNTVLPRHSEHHLVIRTVVPDLQSNGADRFSVGQIDKYLNEYLRGGWEIISTHFISHSNEGDVFAWILVR